MLGLTLRASRKLVARNACRHAVIAARRTLITPTAIRQADLVQEMYLRELKNFKPTPVKPSDAEGHVHTFSMPSAPQSPEEANIQNELKAYEDQVVEVEGQSSGSDAASAEQDWFEEEEEDEATPHH